jgi:hypothetical protein
MAGATASCSSIIGGGGMTADAAAHGIRELDLKGTLGLIDAEGHGP